MSDGLKVHFKKSHIAVLSVIVLVASASAAVNIRDPMNVFGGLNMQQNEITNTTKVEFGTDYLQKYSGNDNKIDINELGAAGQDFASGEISLNQLRMVEIMFDNGIPVTNDVVRRFDNDNNGQISITELGAAGSAFASTGPDSITLGELQTIGYYHRNDLEVGEPLQITAAMKTTNGKLIASGIAGRDNSNFSVRTNINMNGNNIYDVGNIGSGGGGGSGSGGLNWEEAYDVSDHYGDDGDNGDPEASISCDANEILVSATCGRDIIYPEGGGGEYLKPVECETRTITTARITTTTAGNAVYASGTCVPEGGSGGGGGSGTPQGLEDVLETNNGAGNDNIDMQGNSIGGLDTPQNPDDAATKQYVDGGVLDWSNARDLADFGGVASGETVSVSCNDPSFTGFSPGQEQNEVLVSASCQSVEAGSTFMRAQKCDTRTETTAQLDGNAGRPQKVTGTCVPRVG